MNCTKEDLLLYAVTDRRWLRGDTLSDQVEKALRGGVTFVQYREKNLSGEPYIQEALQLQRLCRGYRVPFVINDNVEAAAAIDADGVHVGQKDMETGDVRAMLGPDKIVGVSAHTVREALRAEERGADYLGVGAAFSTGSKADASVLSHDTIREICSAVKIPVIAIGGIGRENVSVLRGNGLCGIAVISAVFAQPDIEKAASELKELAKKMAEDKEKELCGQH